MAESLLKQMEDAAKVKVESQEDEGPSTSTEGPSTSTAVASISDVKKEEEEEEETEEFDVTEHCATSQLLYFAYQKLMEDMIRATVTPEKIMEIYAEQNVSLRKAKKLVETFRAVTEKNFKVEMNAYFKRHDLERKLKTLEDLKEKYKDSTTPAWRPYGKTPEEQVIGVECQALVEQIAEIKEIIEQKRANIERLKAEIIPYREMYAKLDETIKAARQECAESNQESEEYIKKGREMLKKLQEMMNGSNN